jgi:hypothetical protein
VDVELLTDAEIWLATHDKAANQAYNISNGDTFRWRQVWPKIAAWFGIPEGPLLSQPLDKLMQTPDKEALWNELVKKHGLKQISYKDMAQWEFLDMSLQMPDNFSVVTKLARAGFPGLTLETDAMFVEKLQSLVEQKIIPAYGKGG